MLDQAGGELVAARRVVEELERTRTARDAPQHTEVIGHRAARRIGHEPEVDPAGIGGDLRVGLDGTAGLERGADHLLAELIEPGAHLRGDHGMPQREAEGIGREHDWQSRA
jgi:hypothetical protein